MEQAAVKSERRFPALALSRGIGIGRVVFLHGKRQQYFRIDLEPSDVEPEIERFRKAVVASADQLSKLAADGDSQSNEPVSAIFGVQQLILEESSLVAKIETAIRETKVNAEWALKIVADENLKRQSSLPDPHFREKYLDIEDVSERILGVLSGSPSTAQLAYSGAVVVARELRPSAIMELTKSKPAALITERGGWTSHTSILAREFNLPMASGIRNLDKTFCHGDLVIVDGINGEVILDPAADTVAYYQELRNNNTVLDDAADLDTPTVTIDGVSIAIHANIDIPEAYQLAKQFGAEGIGLFRSESLISSPGVLPSEDEQFSAYRQMAAATGDSGIKIRTFELAPNQLYEDSFTEERNPSLGLRSIRLSLSDPAHFRTQIRAILRAADGHQIDIVLPMISGVGQVHQSRSIVDEERQKLAEAKVRVGDPKIGAMIEIPSSVLTIREIAKHVDFLCLGTNDLVQYLIAVDRDNEAVADLYQTLHPAVMRAITQVLSAADEAGIPAVVCGEMAGSAFYVPLLIGLGARELSMNVNVVPQIRRLIRGITLKETRELVESISSCETADEAELIVSKYYLAHWSGLFPPGILSSKHR